MWFIYVLMVSIFWHTLQVFPQCMFFVLILSMKPFAHDVKFLISETDRACSIPAMCHLWGGSDLARNLGRWVVPISLVETRIPVLTYLRRPESKGVATIHQPICYWPSRTKTCMTFIFCWIATAWESPAHTRIAVHLSGQYLRGEKVKQSKQEGVLLRCSQWVIKNRTETKVPQELQRQLQLNLKDFSKVQDIISVFENLAN